MVNKRPLAAAYFFSSVEQIALKETPAIFYFANKYNKRALVFAIVWYSYFSS